MKSAILVMLLGLYASSTFAEARYNGEKNVVELSTELLDKDTGWIVVYPDKHIEVGAVGSDRSKGKMIGMCGRAPNLGLLFLNGQLTLNTRAPKVTEVGYSSSTDESAKESAAAGWVRRYILRGEDAQDLLDLLQDNRQVGFAFQSGDDCIESTYYSPGKLIVNFDTSGLPRALDRLK